MYDTQSVNTEHPHLDTQQSAWKAKNINVPPKPMLERFATAHVLIVDMLSGACAP